MNTPHQTELDFLLGVYRPLLTAQEATIFLGDCDPERIAALVDEGKLLAVNIGTGSVERCLRIWRYSAEHLGFFSDRPFRRLNIHALMPHTRPTFWRREVAQMLGCTEQHVTNLDLKGPSISTRAIYFRESVIEFITSREIKVSMTGVQS